MAGLQWSVVFGLLAFIGHRRGWLWVTILSIFCLGALAGGSTIGSTVVGGAQALIGGLWAGAVSLLNSVAS